MKIDLIETDTGAYLECLPDGWLLDGEQAALDLIAACGEAGARHFENERLLWMSAPVLIHSATLPDAFFNLHTGLAGAVLLKFSTYQLRCAALIPAERIGDGRFKEMVLEANRSNSEFRVFQNREQAVRWLLI